MFNKIFILTPPNQMVEDKQVWNMDWNMKRNPLIKFISVATTGYLTNVLKCTAISENCYMDYNI